MTTDPQRAKDLFLDALDLPEEERTAFLESRAAGDSALLERARALLEGHRRAAGRHQLETSLVLRPAEDVAPGVVLGDYRVLEQLGEGGFGTVWRAEQLRPLRRQVALKVLHHGLGSGQVLARFDAERQVLARMDHPAIARVFDAGHSSGGRPFFAMELVRGEPIVAYAESRNLGLEQRLGLFVEVCGAIEHAHQKGVLHRDVKPSNVLVQEIDGAPSVKVIDFGIAKALQGELSQAATLTGHLLGTPTYASPEQARGAADVDTRSDVYSLGALLYELIVGEPALGAPTELAGLGLEEVLRRVREVDPLPPSKRSAARHVERRIPPELDWIALACLEKDPARRYPSALALAEDIERFLAGLPVEVAPPRRWYRARKWIARNRGTAVAGAAAVLALLAGGGGTLVGFLRAQERAAESQRQADIARAVAGFLVEDMILAARPSTSEGKGRDVTLVDAVLAATERLDAAAAPGGRFHDAPEVIGRARLALGQSLLGLGDSAGALAQLDAAQRLLSDLDQVPERELLDLTLDRADTLHNLGRYDESIAELETILERPDLGEAPVQLAARQKKARTLRSLGRLDESARLLEKALADAELLDPNDDAAGRRLTSIRTALAITLDQLGEWGEAEAHFRTALAEEEARSGSDHLSTFGARANLGGFLRAHGRVEEARPLIESAAEGFARTAGPTHPDTRSATYNLGWLLLDMGNPGAALAVFARNLEASTDTLGVDHPDTLSSQAGYANALAGAERLDEAIEQMVDVLDRARRVHGPEHPTTLSRWKDTIQLNFRAGRSEWALEQCLQLSQVEERVHGPTHPATITTWMNISAIHRDRGDLDSVDLWSARLYERTAELPMGHALRMDAVLERARYLDTIGAHQGRLDLLNELREHLGTYGEEARPELDTLGEEIARVEAVLAAERTP